MSNILNNAMAVAACTQRIAALNKYAVTVAPMSIDGQPTTLADAIAVYQSCLDTRSAVDIARTAYEKALEARDHAEASRVSFDKGLRAWIASRFGASSSEAKELGFEPPKVRAKSAETKALAVQKNLATREARGTIGKRKKQRIKGTVPAPSTATNSATNGASNGAPPSNGTAAH
jgi:hypothetical protein